MFRVIMVRIMIFQSRFSLVNAQQLIMNGELNFLKKVVVSVIVMFTSANQDGRQCKTLCHNGLLHSSF